MACGAGAFMPLCREAVLVASLRTGPKPADPYRFRSAQRFAAQCGETLGGSEAGSWRRNGPVLKDGPRTAYGGKGHEWP